MLSLILLCGFETRNINKEMKRMKRLLSIKRSAIQEEDENPSQPSPDIEVLQPLNLKMFHSKVEVGFPDKGQEDQK